jgi:multidrug efflux pump subunit AcrB
VVALSIPLTLAIVFALMNLLAIDMQRISLGALIIALALLVDDAMTATDAMLTRLAAGDDPKAAGSFAFSQYGMGMLAGTLVTMAGFVPIGFAASSGGEYTFTLFAVVSLALGVSWVVALVFGPVLGAALLRPPPPGKSTAPGALIRGFRKLLAFAIRARWVTIGGTLAIFALSILALPGIPRQFFPASDRPELLVDLRLPQNASIMASEALVSRLELFLKADPDVATWSSYIGQGAIRFYLPLNVQLPNAFFSQAVVVARSVAVRDQLAKRLEAHLAEAAPGAIARVYPLELGPPVGWPLQYRVLGPEIAEVRAIALRLAALLASDPGAKLVHYDWLEPARELRLEINQDEARKLGLSSSAVAGLINAVLSGTPVTQIRDDIYLVNVALRAREEDRLTLDSLRAIQIALPGGRSVPLSQFASFTYEQAPPLIWRRNRTPSLTVQAEVTPGTLPQSVTDRLEPKIAQFAERLPEGYRIELGGTVEESTRSQASVVAVVPLMLLLMFTVLMLELKQFRKLALVLSIAPLGLIGVVAALLIAQVPLGFIALLGILALIGIIIKNAVILIGQIETERAAGRSVVDAAIEASVLRFRPILLTAISTILGMIPIAPTVFWGPMAFAIMGGLFVATLLTLVFLPTLYVIVFRDPSPAS